jgi:hypothetical protein
MNIQMNGAAPNAATELAAQRQRAANMMNGVTTEESPDVVLRRQDLACDDRMPPLSTFDFSWSNCVHGFYSRWCCCFSCCMPRPNVRGIPAEAVLLPVAEQKQLLDAMKGQWVLQKPQASWMREAMFGGGPTGHFQVMLFEQASIDENRLLLTGGSHYPPKHSRFLVQNYPNVRPPS